jgi:hypothetical protein
MAVGHCTQAASALEAAQAALAAAPREAQKRALARENVTMAAEDLETAKGKLDELRAARATALRAEDEAAAKVLAERVRRAAQMRALDAIGAAFERHVVDGVKAFFADLTSRRAEFLSDAQALNAIWARLGHQYRLVGVDVAVHTGTEQVPPQVSLETLDAFSGILSRRLEQRRQSPQMDRLERAAIMFVEGALEQERGNHRSLREIHILMHERSTSTGGRR